MRRRKRTTLVSKLRDQRRVESTEQVFRAIPTTSPTDTNAVHSGDAAGGALDGNYPSPGIASSVAGAGLAEASNVLSVNVDGSTLEINADALRVKAAGILASHIGDAELSAIAGLSSASNKLPYFTGSGTAALADLTSFARTLLDDSDAATARTTLGVAYGTSSGTVTEGNDSRLPTSGQKSALAGTDGTPGSSNPYVTDSDGRLNATQLALGAAIETLGPTAHWPLDDTSDDSGNGRNLTAQGSVSAGGSAALFSDSLATTDFDGTDDRFTTSYAPFAGSSLRTFIGWAYRDPHANDNHAFIAGDSATAPYVVVDDSLPPFPQIKFDANGSALGSAAAAWSCAECQDDKRFMWGLVFDESADTAELFVNGVSKGVKTVTDNYSSPGNIQLGARGSTPASYFSGKMAHVAVFDKRLSQATMEWLWRISLGAVKNWGLVTALPSSPLPGDTCMYVADSTNGVIWHLVYDGLGSYPWKKIGGPPLEAEVDTSQTSSSGSYTNLGTTGPSITAPLAGDYYIDHGCLFKNNTAGWQSFMSFAIGAAAASDNEKIVTGATALVPGATRRKKTLAAGDAIVAKYRTDNVGTTGTWEKRWLSLDPVRVG